MQIAGHTETACCSEGFRMVSPKKTFWSCYLPKPSTNDGGPPHGVPEEGVHFHHLCGTKMDQT